ncbi:MAG TPA: hypothetical protein VOA64_19305 [Candidatus Dormibacteraeota bacterium]|nr:hypothetical protein [Candidatus Dormibacteraeota bacterium]
MATDAKTENVSSPEPTVSWAPANGASAAPGGPRTAVVIPRATGPRTRQGKEKSKHNALKHGIFSKVVVLKDESQTEFDALLTGLRNDLLPEGTLEEVLVEKLAALLWRNRRLLIAEAAEIRVRADFAEWDEKQSQRENAAGLASVSFNGGLVRRIDNPEALQRCLDLLDELKDKIERDGFDLESDEMILGKLYGYEGDWQDTLFNSYMIWLKATLSSDEERQQRGFASPQHCKDNFLAELKAEIDRLDRYKKEQIAVISGKLRLESLRSNVPDAQRLDRLLRYETTLERNIDRVLSQLERVQRMRLGQPAAPSLNVNVSSA